jgi:hypothetical protein
MTRDGRRGPRVRGRHWLLAGIAVFLAVATVVLVRQRAALDLAARVAQLRERHAALEARRAELERTIRVRSSAAELLPRVGPRGFALPADTAFTILTIEPADGGGR